MNIYNLHKFLYWLFGNWQAVQKLLPTGHRYLHIGLLLKTANLTCFLCADLCKIENRTDQEFNSSLTLSMYIYACNHTYTHVHIYTHIYTYTHAHSQAHTHAYTYTSLHTQTPTHTYMHKYIIILTHALIHLHTLTHRHTHSHKYTHMQPPHTISKEIYI